MTVSSEAATKESGRAYRLAWRSKNKEHIRAYNREYQRANREKCRGLGRSNYLKRRFGGTITVQTFDEMLLAQNNCCAICKSDQPKTKKGWHLDHCHKTGTVRGILCHACNIMLGNAGDDPAVLHAGIEYLNEHSARSNSNKHD